MKKLDELKADLEAMKKLAVTPVEKPKNPYPLVINKETGLPTPLTKEQVQDPEYKKYLKAKGHYKRWKQKVYSRRAETLKYKVMYVETLKLYKAAKAQLNSKKNLAKVQAQIEKAKERAEKAQQRLEDLKKKAE